MPYLNKLECLHCHSLPPSSSICRHMRRLPEWSHLPDSTSLALNNWLEWKWLSVANTLAYYDTIKIIAIKSFILLAPGGNRKGLFLQKKFLIKQKDFQFKMVSARVDIIIFKSQINKLVCLWLLDTNLIIWTDKRFCFFSFEKIFDWGNIFNLELPQKGYETLDFRLFVLSVFIK